MKDEINGRRCNAPSSTTIGSLSKNSVCFQCVGMLCGPVLKLVTAGAVSAGGGFPELEVVRRMGAGRHTSANTASPSRTTFACVAPGTGCPSGAKNVSK